MSEEKGKLEGIATKVIVDYIRTSIEILLNLKGDESGYKTNGYTSNATQQSNLQRMQGKEQI